MEIRSSSILSMIKNGKDHKFPRLEVTSSFSIVPMEKGAVYLDIRELEKVLPALEGRLQLCVRSPSG